ncbi:RDD family protein [Actinomadura xylanilytica]|uniref:RDD family protein n=1 Tax=Actinomadura xylanilytica TaxID=887459 RepID=UPI00255B1668|nr:RDD family protein [Actinomadura xylanilytica]MDL4772282.1 RDD family protein [Actinomadura xylanilytica]
MTQPPQDPGPSSPDWTSPNAPADDGPPPYQGTFGAGPSAPGRPAPPVPGQPGAPHPGIPHPGLPGPPYPSHHYGPPGHVDPRALLAGRWARLGAALLDAIILGIVSAPFLFQAFRWDRMTELSQQGRTPTIEDTYDIPRLMAGYAFTFILGFAYYTVQHARWGQTLGKRAAGIRVVRADDHLAASWGQIAARQGLVSVLAALTAVLNLVGAAGLLMSLISLADDAWILWDDRKQALHDKVGKTVVVKTGPWAPNPYARR